LGYCRFRPGLRRKAGILGCLAVLLLLVPCCQGYSLFTHEQLIDLAWNISIKPLLVSRYPGITEEALREAHAYAYGGCVIQDLGYYPFGNEFFSDLTHYVRSGDFVASLLRKAANASEYAFALGALSHYVGDNIGHREAINPSTAIGFPKLAKKYGPSVTYDEAPHQHIRAEFAFDIGQLSKRRLAPAAYLRFIGLRVARRLLEHAFEETYGIPLTDLMGPRRPAFRSYRWAVRSFLPRVAYAESVLHRDEFPPDVADEAFAEYMHHLENADFQKLWNQYRREPGLLTYLVAFLIKILPKVGPLSTAAIKVPNEKTEDLYIRSVNSSVALFDDLLAQLKKHTDPATLVPNRNLDTGGVPQPGRYKLVDKTVEKLRRMTEGG
jgi:Zinc dependent phospholipase C